jgi:hypothetical protein
MDQLESGNVEEARNALQKATDTTDRTTTLTNDFATLAQYGRTVTDAESVDIGEVAGAAWPDDADATLDIEGTGTVAVDPARFELLFARAFEFMLDDGASTVVVECGDDGVTITGDGEALRDDPERYFDYGDAVSNATKGTNLPLVRTLAQVHGWQAIIDPDYEDGVRLVVTWA